MARRSPSTRPGSGCRHFPESSSATHPTVLRLRCRREHPPILNPARDGVTRPPNFGQAEGVGARLLSGISGHELVRCTCLLMTQSGHSGHTVFSIVGARQRVSSAVVEFAYTMAVEAFASPSRSWHPIYCSGRCWKWRMTGGIETTITDEAMALLVTGRKQFGWRVVIKIRHDFNRPRWLKLVRE